MFENLEGKQIWHISAPSTMPLSEIESLNVANALKGAEVWNHQGVAFEMSPTDVESATLLLPRGRDGEYVSVGTTITRAFRVHESSKPGVSEYTSQSANSNAGEADSAVNFFATQIGLTKPPRKQPENLKARYVPYGVPTESYDHDHGAVNSADEDGDLHMQDASAETASQHTPKSAKKTKSKKKSTNDMDVDETPSKKKVKS